MQAIRKTFPILFLCKALLALVGCGGAEVEDKRLADTSVETSVAVKAEAITPADVLYTRSFDAEGREVIEIDPQSLPAGLSEWAPEMQAEFLADVQARIESETGFYAWYPGKGVLFAIGGVAYVAGAAVKGVATVAYYGLSAAYHGFLKGLGAI